MVRCGVFLKAELTKLPEGLNVWCERERNIKSDLEVPGRMEMPLMEKGCRQRRWRSRVWSNVRRQLDISADSELCQFS